MMCKLFPNYHGQCASACNLVGLLGVLVTLLVLVLSKLV